MATRHRFLTALLLALGAAVIPAGASVAGLTTKVVILIMDGVRMTETYDDPSHAHIPHIWNELCPQGYASDAFYNNGWTTTCAGHASLLTGSQQYLADDGTVRPDRPVLWEYYRDQMHTPDWSSVAVTNKTKLRMLSYSTYPGYGPADSAKTVAPCYEDGNTIQQFTYYAGYYHPAIPCLDGRNRRGRPPGGLAGIPGRDRGSRRVWPPISGTGSKQTPGFANQTALFPPPITAVTRPTTRRTEMGVSAAGVSPSSPWDLISCRGRDTGVYGDLRDIAVTAAAMLGLSAPYATGRVLTETSPTRRASGPVPRPPARRGSYPAQPGRGNDPDLAPIGSGASRAEDPLGRGALRSFRAAVVECASAAPSRLSSGYALPRPPDVHGSGVTWIRLRPVNDTGGPGVSAPVHWIQGRPARAGRAHAIAGWTAPSWILGHHSNNSGSGNTAAPEPRG